MDIGAVAADCAVHQEHRSIIGNPPAVVGGRISANKTIFEVKGAVVPYATGAYIAMVAIHMGVNECRHPAFFDINAPAINVVPNPAAICNQCRLIHTDSATTRRPGVAAGNGHSE